ncbi:MAG: hypothetical protein LBV12_00815 [Puniceicoccales bacterium]|jgi:hypothetical protein|nr:hypothetical protein [Puniceicoccales bacterium]
MAKASPEFLVLADKCYSGEALTEQERERFEQYLQESPAAAEYFTTLGLTEALLPLAAERIRARQQSERKRVLVFSRLAKLGVAAVLALGIGVGFALNEFRSKENPVMAEDNGLVPAKATQSIGVQWKSGQTSIGSRLSADSGEINSGLLELTLDSGVRILLEGPAAYTITGKNACTLHYGKAVVDVPAPAIGFVMEGVGERIVDQGTRFAVSMGSNGKLEKVGVLSGIVDIERPENTLRLFTDYAVERRDSNVFHTTLLKQNEFYREMPTREYPWEITREQAEVDVAKTLNFDLTPLIHGPGSFRVVFKWLHGWGRVHVKNLVLRCDDTVVASMKPNTEAIGYWVGENNSQLLVISPEDWKKGKWTLSLDTFWPQWQVDPNDPRHYTMTTEGVLHVAEGIAVTATAKDFIGKWQYFTQGHNWIREFCPDGTMVLYIDGKRTAFGNEVRWVIEDGILKAKGKGITEYHMIRDDGTLVFLNRNYRNAYRIPDGAAATSITTTK